MFHSTAPARRETRWGQFSAIIRPFFRSLFLTFSGAEKEAKRHPPPTKPPPIWGVLSEKSQKPSTFRAFWYRGTRDEFLIGWRVTNN